jgi:hypothetical protein
MDITFMVPMLPEEAVQALEEPAFTLIAEAIQLAERVHPIMQQSVGDLVRSMNCYYSNLIQDHNTHPRDIVCRIGSASSPAGREPSGIPVQGQLFAMWPALLKKRLHF